METHGSSGPGGGETVWMSIGGQTYAVPVRGRKKEAGADADKPATNSSPPTSTSSSTSSSSPPRKLSLSSGTAPQRERTRSRSVSSGTPSEQPSNTGGWGWLGGLNARGQSVGLGLAESTLSGLYNAVSSSAAYIVQPLAEDEPQQMPSEEEKKELAITPDLVDFVQNVADHPSTFTNFPIETNTGPQAAKQVTEAVYRLSEKQTKHVTAMLALVPKLQQLRHDIVPSQLIEDVFWQVYFSLIARKTEGVDWEREKEQKDRNDQNDEDDNEEAEGDETEAHVQRERSKTIATKVQHRREMILGFDEDDEDEDDHAKYIKLSELRRIWETHKNGYTSVTKISPHYAEDSARLEKLWEGLVFSGKEPGRFVSEQYAHLFRQGIAPSQRTRLWPVLPDAAALIRRNPKLYEEALQRVYATDQQKQELASQEQASENRAASSDLVTAASEDISESARSSTQILSTIAIPATFLRVPTYGGKLITCDHWLNGEGVVAAKRILTVFAIDNPEWDYIPSLPDIVLVLLHYLPEPHVYFTITALVAHTIPLAPSEGTTAGKEGLSKLRFLHRTKREVDLCECTLVDCLLAQHLPRLHAHLTSQCREIMISRDFQKEILHWMDRIFVGVLPHRTVFKVMDQILAGGVVPLYNVALRLLCAHEENLLKAVKGQEFMRYLRSISLQYAEGDMDDSFLFSPTPVLSDLTVQHIVQAELKATEANPQLENIQDPSLSTATLPVVKQSSLVITQEQFDVIWQWLPSRYRVKKPVKHFSSSKDGFSVLSVYRKCKNSAPHVFIIKTKQGKIFGAYLTDGWRPSTKFYGSGECFLFTIHPVLRKYGWSASNSELFMIGNSEKGLMIGGGEGCGIWLDGELWHGSSGYCDTFRNDPLNGRSPDFEAIAVEIYGFSS